MCIRDRREIERELFIYRETDKHKYVCFFYIQFLPKHGTTLYLIRERERERERYKVGRENRDRDHIRSVLQGIRQ